MQEVVAACGKHGPHIAWELPPLGQDPVTWATAHVDRILAQGYVRCFKVGITHKVAWRWCDRVSGYRTLGYRRLDVLAVSDRSDDIVIAETSVIDRYRRYGPGGQVRLGADGDPLGHQLCRNRSPGGEGAHHGLAPFALYCAFGWNPCSAPRELQRRAQYEGEEEAWQDGQRWE